MTLAPFADADQYAAVIGSAPDRAQWDLDGVSAAIRLRAGWHIWPRVTEDITVNGSGGSTLMLPTMKLWDVLACTEQQRGSTDLTTVDVTTLEWADDGYLRRDGCWTRRLRGVTVTIDHGYDDVPDLASLCLDLAARVSAGPAGIVQMSAGMRAQTYARSLTDEDKFTIDAYRRVG